MSKGEDKKQQSSLNQQLLEVAMRITNSNDDNSNQFLSLIEQISDVNVVNDKGYSILMFAAHSGNMEILRALINKKPDLNLCNEFGHNALWYAVENNQYEAALLLIENKIEIDASDNETLDTPLFIAIEDNNFAMVKLLVVNGADVNVVNDDGYMPLSLAITEEVGYEIINLLIEYGAALDEKAVEILKENEVVDEESENENEEFENQETPLQIIARIYQSQEIGDIKRAVKEFPDQVVNKLEQFLILPENKEILHLMPSIFGFLTSEAINTKNEKLLKFLQENDLINMSDLQEGAETFKYDIKDSFEESLNNILSEEQDLRQIKFNPKILTERKEQLTNFIYDVTQGINGFTKDLVHIIVDYLLSSRGQRFIREMIDKNQQESKSKVEITVMEDNDEDKNSDSETAKLQLNSKQEEKTGKQKNKRKAQDEKKSFESENQQEKKLKDQDSNPSNIISNAKAKQVITRNNNEMKRLS